MKECKSTVAILKNPRILCIFITPAEVKNKLKVKKV